jgi:predicted RNase H-like HicB family nuclease
MPVHHEFTAIVERDVDWFVAFCPEVPGANGQGLTRDEALASLRDAIALILDDRREDGLRGVPDDAERTMVTLE